ncbi:acyl-CoA N-acyltransferase [Leucosporidium creatinivorum]|uniref:Glucosamine 6-phosphate N-acetyltransferase n=1 Tax=Leucosporidium creatinivorum TaxID=106004 RepID=A0A1Y2G0F8_9BASI|nr:acyl-CoA N-acyltransferase [Leucosporidium creatinivorum]
MSLPAPDSSLKLAFDATLIPSTLSATLPPGLHLRPLASTDYHRSHLALLATLTQAPDIGEESWTARFDEMVALKGSYYPVVVVDSSSDQLVATGTLLIERKFIRGAALTGHIEDIAVSSSMQGKGLGKKIIEVLTALSEIVGAYKTILDCDPKNEAFYVKCGYENKGFEMARYTKK